jgi:hypothetical protein
VWEQFRAALFVIFWSALVTFILMKLIGLVLRGARYKDEILEIGDLAIHDEEAFPEEAFASLTMGAGGTHAITAHILDDHPLPPTDPGFDPGLRV